MSGVLQRLVRHAGPLTGLGILVWSAQALAKEVPPVVETISIGTAIGMAVFILLAALIALSVAAKLAIVFGLVPRKPQTTVERIVHGLANVVGGLRVTRGSSIRRRSGSASGGGGSFGGGGASGRY